MFAVSLNKAKKKIALTRCKEITIDGILRKKESFVDNFDIIKVSEIEMRLDQLTHSDSSETSQNDIDEIISDIGSLFSESAKSTFG